MKIWQKRKKVKSLKKVTNDKNEKMTKTIISSFRECLTIIIFC